MATRKPLTLSTGGQVEELPATDFIAASSIDITGATEINAALVDSDEVPVYDASATANRKSLLSRIWDYIQAKFGAAIANTRIPFSDGTRLSSSANLTWNDTDKTLTIQGGTQTATAGSELLTNNSFASDLSGWTVTGWTYSAGSAQNDASNTNALSQSVTVTSGGIYLIVITISGRTTGSITVSLGSVTYASSLTATTTIGLLSSGSGSQTFSITPTSDFNGKIDEVSLKLLTSPKAIQVLKDGSGAIAFQLNGDNALKNISIGVNALPFVVSGERNIAIGGSTLYCNVTGGSNVGVGTNSLLYNTTGSFNVGLGTNSLFSNRTGASNMAIGNTSMYLNTSGASNVAIGVSALYNNTTGSNNTAIGYFSGIYAGSGTTANQTSSNSIYLGYQARSSASGNSNEIVIGYNVVGLGSNTTIIGNSSTTAARIHGKLGSGVDSAAAQIHSLATTEQLRLGYDATKYVSHTVDSSGNVLIDAVGTIKLGEASNHTLIAADGTLTLVGTATAWDDLQVEMKESLKGSATKPDWDATNFGLLFPRNDTSEYVVFNIQMPHRWKEGSTVYPHVHFYQDQNAAPTFAIDYRWTNIGEAVSGSWTTYSMGTLVGSQTWTTGLLHRIVHGTNNTGISGSGKTFSSMLQIKLYRNDNTYVGDCIVVSFDLHFEIDSFGTSSEYAK